MASEWERTTGSSQGTRLCPKYFCPTRNLNSQPSATILRRLADFYVFTLTLIVNFTFSLNFFPFDKNSSKLIHEHEQLSLSLCCVPVYYKNYIVKCFISDTKWDKDQPSLYPYYVSYHYGRSHLLSSKMEHLSLCTMY